VAFLAYHSVHPDGPPFISVRPGAFETHLRVLRDRGYATGTTGDLEAMAAGRRPPGRLAFLSFDDGYRDNYEVAWPLLRAHGLRATIFVLPPLLDQPVLRWPEAEGYIAHHPDVMRPLTWTQVETMAADGMVIGSHTGSHPHLRGLGDEELRQELLDSRRAVQERIGVCDLLAYPFGEWDLRVALAAAAAGYRFAFSLPPAVRPLTTPMSIPRISVDQRDTAVSLALKLRPGVRALVMAPATGRLRQARIRRRERGAAAR
jgi:peptidoglycan/xylan/chitin deacetylase (PgdA/CDA1 family)